jgi:hypothetical protein
MAASIILYFNSAVDNGGILITTQSTAIPLETAALGMSFFA